MIYPDGRSLGYAYDANGSRTALTATIGTTVLATSYAYDNDGRLSTVTDPDARVYGYTYDAASNRDTLAQPNGVTTTYTFDSLNRLTNLASLHGATVLQSYAYTLGATGLRTRVDEADGTAQAYGYDALYRLTTETVTGSAADYGKTFVYDPVGNRLTQVTAGAGAATVAYTYDSRDRLLTETGVTYGWDDNGNQITKSGDATYTWDFDDRLVKVTKADGTVVDHVYDVDGNRVKTTVTPSGGTAAVTNMLVDACCGLSQVVAETDGAGSVGAYYVRGGGELLGVRRGPAALQSYLADGLGSVRALTDGAGAVTDTKNYSAYGETIASSGVDAQPYGFAGEAFDSTSGLSYNRARWMDVRIGRFLGMDPLSEASPPSLSRLSNAYAYADGSPVSLSDSSGLFAEYGITVASSQILTAIELPNHLIIQAFLSIQARNTPQNVEDLATVLTSEASVGNDVERRAVGSTVVNRMIRRGKAQVRDVWSAYAHNQAPTAALRVLAQSILDLTVRDNTQGCEFYYSPRSMPKEGESTVGFSVGGGLELIPGQAVRNYVPTWVPDYDYVEIEGVREWYFKFYHR